MSGLLRVEDLSIDYFSSDGALRAVDSVSFEIARGETLAIVGESGSGKSTVAHALMRLITRDSGRISGGRVLLDGCDLASVSDAEMRGFRGRRLSIIFQDPMMALNPVHTIGDQIAESAMHHEAISRKDAIARAIELLATVGVPAPERRVREYPHSLSGGMRQRVMIAIALAARPALLIADEPTTALDVTVQAQVLDLLDTLREKFGMAVLLITHDLGVVSNYADRVAVMYAGRVVEDGRVSDVFSTPAHPYTQGLLGASDWGGDRTERLREIPGIVPPLGQHPSGCTFAPRCHAVRAECRTRPPIRTPRPGSGQVACYAASAAG